MVKLTLSASVTLQTEDDKMFSFLFGDLDRKLDLIIGYLEKVMATQAEFQAAFERIDTATTQIADIIRDVSAKLGGMTTEEEDAAKQRLNGVADALEALASQGPTNPVPVEPPV